MMTEQKPTENLLQKKFLSSDTIWCKHSYQIM